MSETSQVPEGKLFQLLGANEEQLKGAAGISPSYSCLCHLHPTPGSLKRNFCPLHFSFRVAFFILNRYSRTLCVWKRSLQEVGEGWECFTLTELR